MKGFNEFRTYALVTGAASGMGRIYSLQLAQKGYNIIMVDINAAGLQETERIVREAIEASAEISREHKDAFRMLSIAQDLSVAEAADKIHAVTEAAGCVVEVLVNNAGVMYCQGIAETSERMLNIIMMVHMYTPLMLCRKYVVGMKERKCGYILNISSLAAWMIWPGIGMYGQTKRFVRNYSRELRIECQKTGVSVTNAYFGAVDTPLIPLKESLRKLARALAVMIRPETAVKRALNATFRRRRGTMPGLLNKIFLPFILIMPDCLLGWIYRKAKPYLMKV
ncbi:MAG: SDR family NAD(P)-dependent oxidoreductase [Bacteroidales bacterium]|jgi:short-subunit dehydrogenase|nr:SDR family NAD(P)-dependent oxidoreductase [Bacteroidales bacterium]